MFHAFTTLHHGQKTRARSEDLAFLCYTYSIHSGRRWSSSRRRYASAPNLAVEVGFERSVESRLDEAHLLWGHLAARSCCGSGRGHRRRREAPERSLGLFPCRQAPDHLRVPAQHRNSLRSGFQFFGRYECLDLPRAVPAGVILSDQLGLFLEDMEVVDRGLGGVHLVQHGRGDGGERGYALAVVT